MFNIVQSAVQFKQTARLSVREVGVDLSSLEATMTAICCMPYGYTTSLLLEA
jgi:hypothetical protein